MTIDELMRTNGLDISDWDAPVYRIFSLDRFKQIITYGQIGLVRTHMWDDPFENFFLKCKVQTASGEIASLKPIHDGWHGQCWTLQPESDAMWRIYSHGKGGIRVSTTIRELFAAVCDPSDEFARLKYFIGAVQYCERSEIEDFLRTTSFVEMSFGGLADKFARTLCVKRSEFAHEKELRILVQDVDHRYGDVMQVPFDYASILKDAVCDPRLESADFDRIRSELLALDCTVPISQSDLYKIDEITIAMGS